MEGEWEATKAGPRSHKRVTPFRRACHPRWGALTGPLGLDSAAVNLPLDHLLCFRCVHVPARVQRVMHA